jgi:hypothetical protein
MADISIESIASRFPQSAMTLARPKGGLNAYS